jgi:hypothetical protein
VTLGYGLTLAALIAQISLPWLQSWHDAREQLVSDIGVAVSVAVNGAPVTAPAETHIHRAHDGDACPVCRLIGQSRNAVVVVARRIVGVTFVHAADALPKQAAPQIFSANAAAPRAPPSLLG